MQESTNALHNAVDTCVFKCVLCENGIFNTVYKACFWYIFQESFTNIFLLLAGMSGFDHTSAF